VKRRAEQLVWQIFDEDDVLFRIFAIRVKRDDFILGIVIHHIICDGVSVSIVRNEIFATYESLSKNSGAVIDGPKYQYSDIAIGVNSWLDGSGPASHMRYWSDYLRDAPSSTIPSDYLVHSGGSGVLKTIPFAMKLKSSSKIPESSKKAPFFESDMFLSVFMGVLSYHLNQSDVVIVPMLSGRYYPESLEVVGLMMDAMALRCQIAIASPFIDLLNQVSTSYLRCYDHQALPYFYVEKLLQEIGAAGGWCWVNFRRSNSSCEPGNSQVTDYEIARPPEEINVSRAQNMFHIRATLRDNDITGEIEYSDGMYKEDTIVNFIDNMVRLFSLSQDDPARPLVEILDCNLP